MQLSKAFYRFLKLSKIFFDETLEGPLPPLPPVKSSRFNVLTFQRFNLVFASPGESNPVQPNPTIPPLTGAPDNMHPTKSEYIRLNPTNFFNRLLHSGKVCGKEKCYEMSLISLFNTF
jgi:hypothetical protein